jgi:DUF971 family protein
VTPVELRLEPAGKALIIAWDDGLRARLSARFLRSNCRSAGAVRLAMAGLPVDPAVCITGMQLVGIYALNLAFSDGQDRGIYPWIYLRDLAQEADSTVREAS